MVNEYNTYILETLFTFLPWANFIIPMMLVLTYILNKSLRALGRSVEVLFILILGGLILTLFIPIEYVEIANIFPIMEQGFSPILTAAFYCNFSVGDFFVHIMLLGRFKLEKNSHLKIFNYAFYANILIFIFYIVFFAVFGITSTNQSLAIGDLPLFAAFHASVGRIGWITINLWSITSIFQAGMLLSLSLKCFNYCFSSKHKYFGVTIIVLIVFSILQIIHSNTPVAINIATHPVFVSIYAAVQVGIVVIMYIAGTFVRKKNKGSSYVEFNKKIFTE